MFHSLSVGFTLFAPPPPQQQKNIRLMVIEDTELPVRVRIVRTNPWKFHFVISALILFLLPALEVCDASGYFELQINKFNNSRGRLADGSCCNETKGAKKTQCSLNCRTYFRVCLKEYQSVITPDGSCTFGSVSSGILGGNSFTYATDSSKANLVLRFEFAWTTSYTLILEAREEINNLTGKSRLIERVSHRGVILPGQKWHTFTHDGNVASITHRIRVVCHAHYYNTTCTKFCRPRNDRFGHYICTEHGDKACLPGWMGNDCTTPLCLAGCHATHGSCDSPGVCNCEFGWQGPLCDQCIPYPGCLYGSCQKAWTCECDRNWGGILCNKDLNYCGSHHPCLNNGICRNERPDEYSCACPEGFSGRNCERVDSRCATNRCQNGGTCQLVKGDSTCTCASGWTGSFCETGINECNSNPCQNGAHCQDLDNGFNCHCPTGWQGTYCELQQQVDEDSCHGSPCGVHTASCHKLQSSRNVGGIAKGGQDNYQCLCQPGWTGSVCNVDIKDCVGQCENGATCLDLVNGYQCACAPGFTGIHCEQEIDECSSHPCQNGAICHDAVNRFSCECRAGYFGPLCQNAVNMCNPDPCKNGARCYDLRGDFFCRCLPGFEGKDCSQKKTECPHGVCEVIDSCTIHATSGRPLSKVRRVSSNVCGRHGICWSFPNGDFTCQCQAGYQGRYCHDNINDCANSPCQNDGTCIDGVNSYQCICAPGWDGPNCTQDIDDCTQKPCHHDGVCTDQINDFRCICVHGWKGKTCMSRSSQCDGVTCSNGGTCIDLGSTFRCACASGYHGSNCQIASWRGCDSNPCQNGGTCVNSGDSITCLCKEGFEGQHCEIDKNDCDPFPCYNGEKCVDGVNWYICDCKEGFAGPDCRININECASRPCAYGSTCIDGVGSYKCICPPGRTGHQCNEVIGRLPAAGSCSFKRKIYADQSSWLDECNSCQCTDGWVQCTKVWCGPGNCLSHPNVSEPIAICAADETCVVQTAQTCFTPPCLPWGQCRHVARIEDAAPRGMHTTCIPNMASLSNNCAKIDLLFDKTRMPTGVSVGNICSALRILPQVHTAARQSTVIILCAIHVARTNTIQITVSTDIQSEITSEAIAPTLRDIVENIASAVSRKMANSSALQAVVDVQVETNVVTSTDKSGNDYTPVIPVLCAVVSLLGVVSLVLVVFWCLRRRRRRRRHHHHNRRHHHHHHHHHCVHSRRGERGLRPSSTTMTKSNNEVDEHVTPFQRNALFDAELSEIDIDKYEKASNRPLNPNPSNQATSPNPSVSGPGLAVALGRAPGPGSGSGPNSHRLLTSGSHSYEELKPKAKMTNIEISRTLAPNNASASATAAASAEREIIM